MLRNLILCISALTAAFASMNAQTTDSYAKPDFAFPTKVAENARAMLSRGLNENDGSLTLRALMNLSIALTDIDTDSATTVIADCRRASSSLKSDADRALVDLLTARIYAALYQQNRWNYDRREQPATESSDYKLWNGNQWRDTIMTLVDRAMSPVGTLAATPCASYSKVLSIDARIAPMYPTLLDFIASQSVDILSSLGDTSMLPARLLCPWNQFIAMNVTIQKPLAAHIIAIYDTWIQHASKSAPALIAADISRLKFINNNAFSRSDDTTSPRLRTYTALMALWKDHKASRFSTEALINAYDYLDTDAPVAMASEFIEAAEEQLAAYPSYFRNDCLKNDITRLRQPSVEVKYPSTIAPGDSLQLSINVRNARDFYVNVYSVPYTWQAWSWGYELTKAKMPQLKLTKSVKITCDSVAPFRTTLTRKVPITEAGTYIVAPVFPGKTPETGNYVYVHCSAIRLASLSFNGTSWPIAINPSTGMPLEGVTLQGYISGRDFKLTDTKTTDADGMAVMNDKVRTVFAKKGTDRFAESISLNTNHVTDKQSFSISGFTSLPLYHPGDTVEWAAVAQSFNIAQYSPLAGKEVRTVLYDANYQAIDTVTATTDPFGRIEGRFAIPKDGLTGSFALRFFLTDKALNDQLRWSNTYFTVSDYKLPTYRVEVTDIERDTPSKGDVTVKGRAITYSGFPVGDAAVSVNLKVSGRTWWSTPVSFASIADTTAADGTFSILCSQSLLESSPVDNGIFRTDITITSPSGENRTTSTSFTLGKPLLLRASLPNTNVDADRPLKLNIELATVNGVRRDAPVEYTFLNADSTVAATGYFDSANPVIDIASVASGVYHLRLATQDSALADATTIDNVTVYRVSDTSSPDPDALLWTPSSTATIGASVGIDMLYATTAPETWIVYILTSGSDLIDKGWIKVGAGMHRFSHQLPAKYTTAKLQLATTQGYKYTEKEVEFTRETLIQSLDISIESFRDRIVPGDSEHWTFNITGGKDSSAVSSAIMLDIYNKALDAITPQRFALTRTAQPMPYASININNGLGWYDRSIALPVKYAKNITMPSLDYITWGRALVGSSVVRALNGRLYGARTLNSAMTKNESATDSEEILNTVMVTEMSAPAMSVVREAKVAYDSSADESEADTGGGYTPADHSEQEFAYRDAETPLAMFAPMLTTGADGTLRVDFNVPNANATWALKAIAYNADMLIGSATREMIAAKPVMVQPNLPRFLRNGDRATVIATVMNNADSTANVTTHVEIFDPATGRTLNSYYYNDMIAPGASTTVATDIDAPSDALMLGYRVKSSTGRFADGEQAVIPVLAASQPVVESTPFYIPADTLNWAVKLPKIGKDARVTLQFCENPAWYVATALPGIRGNESRDALSASAAIFSAAVADGLLRDQPDIAAALREWTASDRSDSTLSSMLERNADLKIVLLNASPWVMDARSQSERMERLALLFNPGEIKATYASSISQLKQLQCADGGLAWTPLFKESSMWATENVLLTLGRLKQFGWLPSDKELDTIIANAIGYIDTQTAKYARKHPDSTDDLYVYIRSLYPQPTRPGECLALTTRTVAKLLKSWRDLPAGSKALAALILHDQNHKAAAREVVASLRDFAVTSPDRGMWWPSLETQSWWSMGRIGTTALILDAFAAVDPSSSDIDRIRQWLIIQKEATDWGSSVATSEVIASILRTGTKWTRPASPVTITIGKNRVTPGHTEALLGEMRTDISSLNPSGKTLSIGKSQNGPSWGAVISQYVGDMSSTTAASCPDLSIEKAIYRRIATPDGETWENADTLHVGDVIQVNLTIRAARDIEYVAIVDNRAACLEPVDQLPTPIWADGICFYRENRDAATNIFITRLPKGTYRLSYLLNVNNAGFYASGLATIQSQYAPAITAHSSGTHLPLLP